jgi:tetratricopeptide (TPR) repeat protein
MILLVPAVCLMAADTGKAIFEKAAAALAAKDYPAAEAGFQAVLRSEPRNVGALGNLGVVYVRTGQYANAIATYQKALKIVPQDPALKLNLGLAYVKQERYAEAFPLFEGQATPQAQELLATCLLFTGRTEEALQKLKGLSPTPGVLYLTGTAYSRLHKDEEAKSVLESLLRSTTEAQGNFLAGKLYYDSGRLDEAAAAFEKAAGVPGQRRELGKVFVSLRRNEEAIAELRTAIKEDGGDAEAYYFLGAVLVREKQPGALINLERAITLNPDAWGAHYYLGRLKIESGRLAEAVDPLRKAAALNPNEAAIFYLLARALSSSGREAEAQIARDRVKALKAGQLAAEIDVISKPRRDP